MERDAGSGTASVGQPPRKDAADLGGVIFATESAQQLQEFMDNLAGRASEEHFQYIRNVRKGIPVFFLRNGELFGVFEACEDGVLVNQPHGEHYAQVRVRCIEQCHPLPSELFLPVLGKDATLDNMKLQLTKQQAKSLMLTFKSCRRGSQPPVNGYSRGPPQKLRGADPNWGYDRKPHYHSQPRPQPHPHPSPQAYPPSAHSHPDEHYRHAPAWREMPSRPYPPPHHYDNQEYSQPRYGPGEYGRGGYGRGEYSRGEYGPPRGGRGAYGPRPMPTDSAYSYGYHPNEDYLGPPRGDYHGQWGEHPPPYGPPPHYPAPGPGPGPGPRRFEPHREAADPSRPPMVEPIEKQPPPVVPPAPPVDKEKEQLQAESLALKQQVQELERELQERTLKSQEDQERIRLCENEQARLEKLLAAKDAANKELQREMGDVRAQVFSSYDFDNEITTAFGASAVQGGTQGSMYSRPVSPAASQGSYPGPPVDTGIVPPPMNGVADGSHLHHQAHSMQSPRSEHRSQGSNVPQQRPTSPSQQGYSLPTPTTFMDQELPTPYGAGQQGVQSSQANEALPQPNLHPGSMPNNTPLPIPLDTNGGAPAQHHCLSNAGFQTSVANFHNGNQRDPGYTKPQVSPRPSSNASGLANGASNGEGVPAVSYGMGSGGMGAGAPQSPRSGTQAGYPQPYNPTASEMGLVHTARPGTTPQRSPPMRNLGPLGDNPIGLGK